MRACRTWTRYKGINEIIISFLPQKPANQAVACKGSRQPVLVVGDRESRTTHLWRNIWKILKQMPSQDSDTVGFAIWTQKRESFQGIITSG